MQPHVAGGAVAVFGVEHIVRGILREDAVSLPAEIARAVVAFEAHGEYNGPSQQARIHRTVRPVAGLATLDSHRGVLEHERAAFIGMTADAGLLIAGVLLHHARTLPVAPGGSERAVGIVAIRTLHETLIHAVLGRHFELGADVGVTGVTEIGLLASQQKLRRGGFVN